MELGGRGDESDCAGGGAEKGSRVPVGKLKGCDFQSLWSSTGPYIKVPLQLSNLLTPWYILISWPFETETLLLSDRVTLCLRLLPSYKL